MRYPDGMRLAAMLLFAAAAFPESLDQVISELAAVRDFKEAAISPDGARVAWVAGIEGKGGRPSRDSAVYLADARAGSKPRHITAGRGPACMERGLAWSPDSSRIAFLSDCAKAGQLQLYVAPASGGMPRKLTSLTGYLAHARWSPDGKQLAVLFTENSPRMAGPTEPETPDQGVVEQKIYEQRITIVDPAGGAARQVSPADLYVYEYDWSPDGKTFAATAAHGAGDNNWWIAELCTISAATGEAKPIFKPGVQQQMENPRWSPDGKAIAFIGGLMSDEDVTGGEIFVAQAGEGGWAVRNLTPGIPTSVKTIWWPTAGRIVFAETRDGASGMSWLDPATGQVERLAVMDEMISANDQSAVSLARDGRTSAMIRRSWRQPPEVWAGPVGEWQQITSDNRGRKQLWGEAKSIHWKSDDFTVQGWLLYPREFDPGKRYPLVVSVHGGPASAKLPSWPGLNFDLTPLSHEGYFVLFPNPRGSYGQGEKFTAANVKDFGGGDLRDILAGVDEVLKTVPVDPNRVGVAGWSYGGFMTMWAVTQTNRFRAAVAGAGIANWQSYYGENSIDQWMIPFFGASVYADPAVYAKSSPITYIRQVKTPTLILVGDRDGECPPAQSYEFWHALKTLEVKTQFVIYPGEGHRIWQPEHRRDLLERTIAWFNEHLR
jgi:dipeptidyl aminopeptidase/acylaminoacyl peptidase